MKNFPNNLLTKLNIRKQNNALRQLPMKNDLIDFSSNDYIGFAKSETIFNKTNQFLKQNSIIENGATGSRLLSGNHPLYDITENCIAQFHQSESALIFNSGYDANIGFFSAVPQRNDLIFYDELCHASIRDGIQMSHAKSFKFAHNDFEDLEKKIQNTFTYNNAYIVTESVFSMDGDCPNLELLVKVSKNNNCYLVVDEAHSLCVFGSNGEGLIQSLGIQDDIFARIVTFGKGLGCHGSAILGSQILKDYLINFARSFIYSTGLSPHSIASIYIGYQHLKNEKHTIEKLRNNILFFNQEKLHSGLKQLFVYSKSAIHCAIIPGNEKVKEIALQLQEKGFDVKPILSPTVPKGQERLRFCLHSYNSEKEISEAIFHLKNLFF